MNSGRVILAGGSGFLGSLLARHFAGDGREVIVLTRTPGPDRAGIRDVSWDGANPGPWTRELDGAAAVINLAGRTVDCRYNLRNRTAIMDSRVLSTRVLGQAIAGCQRPPPCWLNSSTATIYRHNFGPAWDEGGEIGSHPDARDAFSVEVARAWERELAEAATPGTRKVALRSAMVLGLGRNSVFPVLCRLARLGLGGSLAGGRQFVSWIHQLDFARAIDWILSRPSLSGPVNLAAPGPVTNAELMSEFRRITGRKFGMPATRWMLEIGAFVLRTETELVLKSRRVVPRRLVEDGFRFQFERLRDAIEDLSTRIHPSAPAARRD